MAVVLLTAPIEGAPFHRAHSGSRRSTQPSHLLFLRPLAGDCAFHDLGCPNLIHLSPTRAQIVSKQAGDWTVLHCAH